MVRGEAFIGYIKRWICKSIVIISMSRTKCGQVVWTVMKVTTDKFPEIERAHWGCAHTGDEGETGGRGDLVNAC